jgi:hypothetical protein
MTHLSLPEVGRADPPPRRRGRYRRRATATVIVAVVLAVAVLWALSHRQYLEDQATVWSYSADGTIRGYIDRSVMSDKGEFLFLASRPAVAGTERFNEVCANTEDGAGILGCYSPGAKTITLFDVTDDRLDGIEEVVAAHEMLHAAWDRMSPNERDELMPLLEAEYTRMSGDAAFVARMDLYARLEPGERSNELHSIVGTEVDGIDPELEAHFAEYFDDRSVVLGLHAASNAVFVDLEARSDALLAELEALRTSIEADYAGYNAGYDTLNADVDAFNDRADSGSFSSTRQFDRAREALIARQDDLDALFASIQVRSDEFDAKAAELDSLNSQATDLNTSLNIVPRDAAPAE